MWSPSRHPAEWPARSPARWGHPVNSTRSQGNRAGRPQDPSRGGRQQSRTPGDLPDAGPPSGPQRSSEGSALEPAPFAFRQPAPDPEALVVLERVLQALGPHLAAAAHLLGFSGGAALFGEERLRVGLRAQRTVLPVQAPGIVLADTKDAERDDLSHGAPPTSRPRRYAPYRPRQRTNYTSEITPACLAPRQAGYVIMTSGFGPDDG